MNIHQTFCVEEKALWPGRNSSVLATSLLFPSKVRLSKSGAGAESWRPICDQHKHASCCCSHSYPQCFNTVCFNMFHQIFNDQEHQHQPRKQRSSTTEGSSNISKNLVPGRCSRCRRSRFSQGPTLLPLEAYRTLSHLVPFSQLRLQNGRGFQAFLQHRTGFERVRLSWIIRWLCDWRKKHHETVLSAPFSRLLFTEIPEPPLSFFRKHIDINQPHGKSLSKPNHGLNKNTFFKTYQNKNGGNKLIDVSKSFWTTKKFEPPPFFFLYGWGPVSARPGALWAERPPRPGGRRANCWPRSTSPTGPAEKNRFFERKI